MAVSGRSAALAIIGGAASTAALALLMTPAMAGGAPPQSAAAAALTGSCGATAHVDSQWYGGEIVTVTITNTSAAAATKWAATWTLATGQQVVSAWKATVTTTGGITTAVNASYNGALAPGASTTFGMQLSGPAVAPTPSCTNDAPGASTGADVTLTEADTGRTLTLQVGQTVAVHLGSQYLPPTAAGTNLVQLPSTGGYPSGQPVAALYRAVVPGPVDITTHTDAACLHDPRPCTIPIALWQVHITVADVPSTGRTVTLTQIDNTRLLSLHVGDLLVVQLPSMYRPLELSNHGLLLLRDTTGGYPTGRPLVTRYTAAIQGRTDLGTVTDNACMHQPTPCPTPAVPWTVHLTVTA